MLNNDIKQIESILDIKIETSEDEYIDTYCDSNDLDVKVDGFEIVSPMGLGSMGCLKKSTDGVMIMGNEVMPVQKALIK